MCPSGAQCCMSIPVGPRACYDGNDLPKRELGLQECNCSQLPRWEKYFIIVKCPPQRFVLPVPV